MSDILPPPEKTISVPFIVKRFDFNRYNIRFEGIRGILNIANVVSDVVKPPPGFFQDPLSDSVGIRLTTILSFTNQGSKVKLSTQSQFQDISIDNTIDITHYIQDEERQEPWNEYALAGSPSKILKTKTTLMKLLLLKDRSDESGNPVFNATHNTVHDVYRHPVSEAGNR